MTDFRLKSGLGQPFSDFFSDHNRAVLPSGTPKCNSQVSFTFGDIVRQEVDQQIGNTGNELAGLWKRPDIPRHSGVLAGEVLEAGDVVRVGQKSYVEDQIAVGRHTIAEPEAGHVDH